MHSPQAQKHSLKALPSLRFYYPEPFRFNIDSNPSSNSTLHLKSARRKPGLQ
jgi:hypothetical protein